MSQGIIRDFVSKEQYGQLKYAVACEDCTHFDQSHESCTFGYTVAPHLRRNQLVDVETTGMVAFCRAIEID